MRSADRGERLKEKVCEAKTKKEVDCFNQLQLQLHMSSGDYDKVVITNILNKNSFVTSLSVHCSDNQVCGKIAIVRTTIFQKIRPLVEKLISR